MSVNLPRHVSHHRSTTGCRFGSCYSILPGVHQAWLEQGLGGCLSVTLFLQHEPKELSSRIITTFFKCSLTYPCCHHNHLLTRLPFWLFPAKEFKARGSSPSTSHWLTHVGISQLCPILPRFCHMENMPVTASYMYAQLFKHGVAQKQNFFVGHTPSF